MAKKQHRKQQPIRVGVQAAAPVAGAPAATLPGYVPQPRVAAPAASATKARPGMTWSDFQERYRHVNGELKQIGMIAGSFLVVLLVLALILR